MCLLLLQEMNGKKIIPGCNLLLMVKYADSNKKTKNRPLQNAPALYNSLTHLEIAVSFSAFFLLFEEYLKRNPDVI